MPDNQECNWDITKNTALGKASNEINKIVNIGGCSEIAMIFIIFLNLIFRCLKVCNNNFLTPKFNKFNQIDDYFLFTAYF